MDWKYVKSLKSSKLVSEFERTYNFKFPDDYKTCILAYNGGRPAKRVFNTYETKEREIKSLLSFNREDRETIWIVNENDDFLQNKYIAFATDSSGNLICFDKSDCAIVFVDHETNTVEKTSDDFTSFIDSLYNI